MYTKKLSSILYDLTSGTPVGLKSAETIKNFIDSTVNECIQLKVFDDYVRSTLTVALEMYTTNIIDGLQDEVNKLKTK